MKTTKKQLERALEMAIERLIKGYGVCPRRNYSTIMCGDFDTCAGRQCLSAQVKYFIRKAKEAAK